MKRLWVLLLLCSAWGHAQTYVAFNGNCAKGGQNVVTQGLTSSTTVIASYPLCTVSVFLTGTTNAAQIYPSATGGVLPNPFTANTDGSFLFFALPGVGYDITMSGAGLPSPVTLTGVLLGGGGGGGAFLPLAGGVMTGPIEMVSGGVF